MSYYFGLYFGNTNMCLAVHRDGKTEVIANSAGDRVTPAVVAFVSDEMAVGLPAKQRLLKNGINCIHAVKQLLSEDQESEIEDIESNKCKIINENGLKYEIEQDGKVKYYTPFDVLVLLFTTMKDIAQSHCHDYDVPIVVTVPYRFTFSQVTLIRNAIIGSGFRLLRVISEPAAALMAYDVGQDAVASSSFSLVVRIGGTSMDVTVVHVLNGMYQVLSHVRKNDIGGNLFSELLANFCSSEFEKQHKISFQENKRSIMKLYSAAEMCKHILSMQGSASCFADSLYNGLDFSLNISRARFESLINMQLQQCIKVIEEALENSHLSSCDINSIVLAGGSCKIPKLQQFISDVFPSVQILSSISPDEVIAVGAANEAIIISDQGEGNIMEKDCIVDLLSCSISVKVLIANMLVCDIFFPKNALIPMTQNKSCKIGSNVGELAIEICQENTNMSKFIKTFTIDDILSSELELKVSITRDRSINILFLDKCKTVKHIIVRLQSNKL